jgi:hypothetical protein
MPDDRRPEWLRVIDGGPRKCGPDGPEADDEVEPTYLGTLSTEGRRRDFHMVHWWDDGGGE